MSEFWERFRGYWSRARLRDTGTQLTLAGSVAAIVLIVAVVASSTGGTQGVEPAPPGSVSERAAEIAAELAEEAEVNGTRPASRTGRAAVSGPEAQAEAGAVRRGVQSPITDTEIKVGIAYNADPGTANAAAGFAGIGQIDQRRGWEAVIADINKSTPHGRKVVPVWYATSDDEIQSKGVERLEQEACARWTQDNRVFLVWNGILGFDTLHSCLTKARIPNIGGAAGLAWSKTYQDYPYFVSPAGTAMDRMAAFQIDQLHSQRFFSDFKENSPPYTPQRPADGQPRIGLIRYDTPAHKAGATAMKRRLAAQGLSLCEGCEFEVTYSADNVQEQLNDATEVNAAIQSFKARGVTHVMFLGTRAGVRLTIFFLDGAEKQQYRPRLGFNSQDAPGAAANFVGSTSYPQLRQSILVTTVPGDFEGETEAFARCKEIFEDAGEGFGGSDDRSGNKEGQIPAWCDAAWYTLAVLNAAGRTLSLESWIDGVHTMTPVPSASTFLMQTKPDRRDGAGAIRIGEWFDDCDCFKATSGDIPV